MIDEKVYLMGRDSLPALNGWVLKLMKLYSFTGMFKKSLKKQLKFSDRVDILPGITLKAGLVICEGRASLADTVFVDYAPVYIGDNVSFSFRNMVVTSTHDLDDFNRVITKPVFIEDNVWVTTNVTILAGVRIGQNSVIGAGSVVTRDIPANVFAAGNPCVPVKKLPERRGG